MYSQNEEEKHILDFFADHELGTLLDIGANDGRTFSNSLRLIEAGWKAVLVEPSARAIGKLRQLHKGNKRVAILFCAVGTETGNQVFHDSGAHLPDKSDTALLSTLVAEEKEKWQSTVEYAETNTTVYTYADLLETFPHLRFDFITIDAEGMDVAILKQIDLSHTKLLCIEWNSIQKVKDEILNYTALFDMSKVIYQSAENLIIAR